MQFFIVNFFYNIYLRNLFFNNLDIFLAIEGLDPADLRFAPYEVFVGHNTNDSSGRKSEIIILRKTEVWAHQ
jgi:hypothetical protein